MTIRNTTSDMQDPINTMAFLVDGLADGNPSRAIERMEALGQQQVIQSEQLPAKILGGDRADFEALGFTFGDPDPADHLFIPATLPAGWTRHATDHAMWSKILDQHGRPRVSVGYKAAFYDRWANMNLNTVYGYVQGCIHDGVPIITDDTWATNQAVTDALGSIIADRAEQIDAANRFSTRDADDLYWINRAAQLEAEKAAAAGRLAEFTGEASR